MDPGGDRKERNFNPILALGPWYAPVSVEYTAYNNQIILSMSISAIV